MRRLAGPQPPWDPTIVREKDWRFSEFICLRPSTVSILALTPQSLPLNLLPKDLGLNSTTWLYGVEVLPVFLRSKVCVRIVLDP